LRCELAGSKGEARRFIEQGGVYVNNVRIEPLQPITLASALHDRYLVIRRGRRQMHLVVIA
jgi:tyrosyl-tRNA synthetase